MKNIKQKKTILLVLFICATLLSAYEFNKARLGEIRAETAHLTASIPLAK